MSTSNTSAKEDVKKLQLLIQNSDFTKATSLSAELLKGNLNSEQKVQIYYLQAVSLRLQKDYGTALNTLQKIEHMAPSHARMNQEKGYNYRSLSQHKSAASHFYLATKNNPALLSAWQALLPIYKQQEQAEASRLCQIQIDNLRKLPSQVLAATDLFYEGNLNTADQLVRAFLRENKHSIPALLLLAEIATKLKAISEAEFILETCVELAPDDFEAKYQLFNIYSKLGKFELASTLADQLTNQMPDNIFYQVAKATALVGLGDIDSAITIYHKLIKENNVVSNVHLLLGHAYKTNANITKAVKAYQSAYRLDASNGDAYWSLANTKTYTFSKHEITSMLSGAQDAMVDIDTKIHLHFALGKSFEDNKEYAKSFAHYAQGNQLKSSQITYSPDKQKSSIDHQIGTFTPEFTAQLANMGHADPSPIFILGMPRAGSTLLEQILASHSQVDGTMELHEILGLAARLSKAQTNMPSYPANLSQIASTLFAEFGKQFIQHTRVYRQSAPFFIDKMPNNFMHIGLIKTILPNAKIIDARRDPMACCFSGYKQLFGDGQEFSYSLTNIAQYYQQYTRIMAHWHEVFPGQILQVDHELVVSDTQQQVTRMLDYCKLDFEQSCIDFHKNKRAVKTPSAEQVRQPIYKDGLDQWKNFAPYLDDLKKAFHL